MKTGTIILFRLVIWFRNVNLHKENKNFYGLYQYKSKLDKSNENSIFECEILQIDGFFRLFEEPTIQHVIGILS